MSEDSVCKLYNIREEGTFSSFEASEGGAEALGANLNWPFQLGS